MKQLKYIKYVFNYHSNMHILGSVPGLPRTTGVVQGGLYNGCCSAPACPNNGGCTRGVVRGPRGLVQLVLLAAPADPEQRGLYKGCCSRRLACDILRKNPTISSTTGVVQGVLYKGCCSGSAGGLYKGRCSRQPGSLYKGRCSRQPAQLYKGCCTTRVVRPPPPGKAGFGSEFISTPGIVGTNPYSSSVSIESLTSLKYSINVTKTSS
jgi:hypothetical protein